MGLDSLQDGLNITTEHPIASSAIAGGVVAAGIGTAIGVSALVKKRRKKTKSKARRKNKSRGRKRKRKTKYARTAGKKRDRSTKRIRMTKTGQPYIILKSGKARFIKKSSARNSRRRKGGRY